MKNIQERSLRFLDAHVDREYLYFSVRNFNGLFRTEIGKSEAEFLGHFKEEEILQKNLHRQVICIGDCLYFIPYDGKRLGIYDKKTREFSSVNIKKKDGSFISKAFAINRDILMIPFELKDPFIMFHTATNTCEIMDNIRENICLKCPNWNKVLLGLNSSCIVENKLFLKGDIGIILSVDMENWQVYSYKLPDTYNIRSLYPDKSEIYLTLIDKCSVIRWNFQTNSCHEYKIGAESTCNPYMDIFRWKTHLLLLPDQKDEIWELDEEKDEWCVKKQYIPEGFFRKRKGSLFIGYQFMGDRLILLPWGGNGMLILSEEASELCEVLYSDEVVKKILEEQKRFIKTQASYGNIMYEDDETGSDLNQLLCALPHFVKEESVENGSRISRQIWNTCKMQG